MEEYREKHQSVVDMACLPEHEWKVAVSRSFQELREQMDANTDICADTQENCNLRLEEISSILSTAKTGLKFLGWIGVAIKWGGIVGAGFAGMFAGITAMEKVPELLQHLPSVPWKKP